jgi:AraC-like DNA-binding protein
MTSRRFWVKGNRDEYAHFLARTHNANLLDVSSPFRFEIKSREFSSLILRRVSVRGHCSNSYQLQDAFIGLMIALPGSGFSTRANGQVDLKPCNHHSIHWHFGGDDQVYAHHLDSDVIYLRLETVRLLRELAYRGLAIADLMALQGREASAGLIRLCEQMEVYLEIKSNLVTDDQWADQLLIDLIDEFQMMSAPRDGKFSKQSGNHVIESLQWFCNQSATTAIKLDQIAMALHVTPRTIQSSFQNQFNMTPMRWLRLWRFSELHRQLFLNLFKVQNPTTLIKASGLGSIDTASRAYRIIYGKTPLEELSLTGLAKDKSANNSGGENPSIYSIDEAIELLAELKDVSINNGHVHSLITLMVKLDQGNLALNQ